ncbi:MAG TPA: DUF72 domain-containing protein [Chloroflexota bacterium]|jgi:uncharacterized protein YecE (DUF72 family)|nr:DUF72 domain-containing protein [Chloroflexota bacterium]
MLRIGCSGWIYRHWKGFFYPEGLPQKRWFEHYARHFDTVEINFTFYRLPRNEAFAAWREQAPPGFVYAVKASRFITHVRRLREPEEGIGRLTERLGHLGDRAGPVLWQLPPDFARDDERLERFLAALPGEYRHTVEFRHASWLVEDVYARLRARGVALTVADSSGRRPSAWPSAVELTADWTYLRFHGGPAGGDYPPDALEPWARRIEEWLRRGIPVWVYFNNDWEGFALRNAWWLRDRLAGAASDQRLGLAG